MEGKTESQKRVYIRLPKTYIAKFAEHYELVSNCFLFLQEQLYLRFLFLHFLNLFISGARSLYKGAESLHK